jgi:hypothetical protein
VEVLIATLTVGPATDGDIQDLSWLNFRLPHAADKPWSRVKKEQWRFSEDVTLTESYRYRVHVFLGLAKRSHYFFEKSDSWSHWMLVCQPTVVFQCDPPGRARRWLKCSQVAGNYIIWKRFEIVASYKCTKQNKVLCPFQAEKNCSMGRLGDANLTSDHTILFLQ